MLERKEIDKKYKWDLSVIYADEAAFNADYARSSLRLFHKTKKLCVRALSIFITLYAR